MDRALIGHLTDAQVIGLTIWGEARNQGPEGRFGVANVIRNRVRAQKASFGWDARGVCLKPLQFSCWVEAGGADNYAVMMDAATHLYEEKAAGPLLRESVWIAEGLLADAFVDNTHGSTHYITTELLKTHPPAWALNQRVLAVIGGHSFFRVA